MQRELLNVFDLLSTMTLSIAQIRAHKTYNERHPDVNRACRKRYAAAHPEIGRAASQRFYNANKAKVQGRYYRKKEFKGMCAAFDALH